MSNPFNKFSLKTKKIKVPALDNAEVEIQEFTVAKSAEYYKRLFSLQNVDGDMKLNPEELFKVKIEKIAECMISPKMTVEELDKLGASANEAIGFISDEIDKLSTGN